MRNTNTMPEEIMYCYYYHYNYYYYLLIITDNITSCCDKIQPEQNLEYYQLKATSNAIPCRPNPDITGTNKALYVK